MIEDPDRTVLLPVSLAEELPTRETAELVARVRDGVGIAVDRVVVNAVTEPPFPYGASDLDERLARLPADTWLHQMWSLRRYVPEPDNVLPIVSHRWPRRGLPTD